MVEYNKVNVKLSDTQLKKLKTAVKNKTGTTLRISLKMFNGNNLPCELLLTTRQKTKLRNAVNNNMPTDLKLSKAKISKITQSGGFLGSLLSKLAGPLMKIAIPLAKNVLAPLLQLLLRQLMQEFKKKIHGSGNMTLIISNEEVNDIIKITQALENSNILIKGVTKTIKNERKEQKGEFLSMILGSLGASLFGNLLTGKEILRAGSGNKRGKGIVRASTGKEWDF